MNLRKTGTRRDEIGNVFVGDHSAEISIYWASASELVVGIGADCRIVKQEKTFEGITITLKVRPGQ